VIRTCGEKQTIGSQRCRSDSFCDRQRKLIFANDSACERHYITLRVGHGHETVRGKKKAPAEQIQRANPSTIAPSTTQMMKRFTQFSASIP